MGTFNIAGRVFTGRSISIVNGRVTIDGVTQNDTISGVVEIRVTEGSIAVLCSSRHTSRFQGFTASAGIVRDLPGPYGMTTCPSTMTQPQHAELVGSLAAWSGERGEVRGWRLKSLREVAGPVLASLERG